MRRLVTALGALLIFAVQPALAQSEQAELPRDPKWTVFVEPEFGTRIDLPAAVFAEPDGPAFRGAGQQFTTPDGRATLAVYSQRNEDRATPAGYLRKNFGVPRSALAYSRVTNDFFVVAGVDDGEIYYSRCNFSRRAGGTLHCFDIKYPQREKLAWDGIVTRMSRSLRAL
jgi:hypothetical protein